MFPVTHIFLCTPSPWEVGGLCFIIPQQLGPFTIRPDWRITLTDFTLGRSSFRRNVGPAQLRRGMENPKNTHRLSGALLPRTKSRAEHTRRAGFLHVAWLATEGVMSRLLRDWLYTVRAL